MPGLYCPGDPVAYMKREHRRFSGLFSNSNDLSSEYVTAINYLPKCWGQELRRGAVNMDRQNFPSVRRTVGSMICLRNSWWGGVLPTQEASWYSIYSVGHR